MKDATITEGQVSIALLIGAITTWLFYDATYLIRLAFGIALLIVSFSIMSKNNSTQNSKYQNFFGKKSIPLLLCMTLSPSITHSFGFVFGLLSLLLFFPLVRLEAKILMLLYRG